MPFMRDGKCVYKKNKDGSRGKKEGCSDSVEKAKDYLKALYANVDDATKKENKTMKMKKSELIALIKEEIMAEAEMFQMSDDDLRDLSVPDPQEYKDADRVFNMVMEDLEKMIEDDLLDIIKEIMFQEYHQTPEAVAEEAMNALIQKLRTKPMMEEAELQEGITDPATQQVLIDVTAKLAPLLTFVSLPVLIKALYDELRDPRNKRKRGDK